MTENIRIRRTMTPGDLARVFEPFGLDLSEAVAGRADLALAAYPGDAKAYEALRVAVSSRRALARLWRVPEARAGLVAVVLAETLRAYTHPYETLTHELSRISRRLRMIHRARRPLGVLHRAGVIA